ncbi:MAG: Gfo/Idh/MocA family oxidoreductase [Verrucomicrobia bacterium]|nr:Gfo/Idh/MocA family oxidoreductase [Verrucomicrobiota bacterium]
MSHFKTVRIAVVGCGNISGPYGDCISKRKNGLQIVGAFDEFPEKSKAFTVKYGGQVYPSLDALLDDPAVEMIVNLTIHTAHAAVTKRALLAGKHVHSEKPLATDRRSGREVVELARRKKLILSCSPFISLGAAQQTLWKAVRNGQIGGVFAVNAEMFHGRPEIWHPNPAPFFAPGAGPMLDVGCYPLNVLTTILGPVAEVRGLAKVMMPERKIGSGPKAGEKFRVTTPDTVFGLLTFAGGAICRLTTTFSAWYSVQAGMELHGTKGTLSLPNTCAFDSPVRLALAPKREWRDLPLAAESYQGVDWSRGVWDAAQAIRTGQPSNASGAQAYHILDVCLGILEAGQSGKPMKIKSRFPSPKPLV